MKLLLATLLLGATALSGACATTTADHIEPPPHLKLVPHEFTLNDGARLATERGSFFVPEDRTDPASRQIEIGFIRFRSTNPNPGRPIVYLAGGPGGSGVAAAAGTRQPIFLALRSVADVIALDQRGTGLSNHLPSCISSKHPDPSAQPLTEVSMTGYYRETLQHCDNFWRDAGVALNGYTTEQSADDMEVLRRAIGVEKLDLWGISYGTHLGLAFMRQYPDSVGKAAFASIEGMDQTVKLPVHIDAAFERIAQALHQSGGAATPDHLLDQMRRIHAQFDAEPQSFTMQTPQGKVNFQMDSFPLRLLASFLPKNPTGIPKLAGLYAALDAGERDGLSTLFHGLFFARPLVMSGMPEIMDLASGISDHRLAQVREQSTTSLTGSAANFPMPQLRIELPEVDLGEAYRTEIVSDIPTLLISGDLDVRTPLEEQREAVRGLSNLHQVIVRNGGHDLFEAHPRIPELLVSFFSGLPVTTRELHLPLPEAP